MKAKNILYFFSVLLVVLPLFGFIGLHVHRSTYARASYDIAECKADYKFADLTTLRALRAGTAPYVNTRGHYATTSLLVYSASKLDKEGLLDVLFQKAITDKADFFGVGDKHDDSVVILQTILSNSVGEESLYCVIGKDGVTMDMLRTDPQFNIAARAERKSGFSFEPSFAVISWGRYWR